MQQYTIKHIHPPKCKTCKKEMKRWNIWAAEHEHTSCASNRIANVLIKLIFQ